MVLLMRTGEMVSYMPQSQTNTNQAPPSQNELREQIREITTEAMQGAQEAARAGGRSNGPIGVRVPNAPPPPGGFTEGRGYSGYGNNNDIPPQAVDMAIGFFVTCAVIAIGWPLARAFGRRIERRSETPALNPGMAEQLQRIEQAVDAMSIEIERISESQRFMAKLQSAQTPERIG